MRNTKTTALIALAVAAASAVMPISAAAQSPVASTSPSAALGAAPSPSPFASPVQVAGVPDGYQLVTNADPAFSMLLPNDWIVSTTPDEGTLFTANAPVDGEGSVTVSAATKGVAVQSHKKWIAKQKKEIKKLADLGMRVIYSGVADYIPAGPAANVEWVNEYFYASHSDEYLFKVGPELALTLGLSWDHAGWDPLWFTVRDSFNPAGLTPPAGFDASNVEWLEGRGLVDDDCVGQLQELYDTLFDLDSRMDIGLVIGEYRTKVGDGSVAYDRTDWDALTQRCSVLVGQPIERALNLFIAAESRWSKCVSDFDCRMSKIEDGLQRKWAGASAILEDIGDTYFS